MATEGAALNDAAAVKHAGDKLIDPLDVALLRRGATGPGTEADVGDSFVNVDVVGPAI